MIVGGMRYYRSFTIRVDELPNIPRFRSNHWLGAPGVKGASTNAGHTCSLLLGPFRPSSEIT